jgi:excisionase family DNA binding protein
MTTTISPHPSLLTMPEKSPFNSEDSSLDHVLLLTPEEAARRLSIGRTTIYALMASGDLSSVTIGRCRRIPVSALRSFVVQLVDDASNDRHRWWRAGTGTASESDGS